MDQESSAQLVEETESFNLEDKSCIPQATLSARSRDKGKQTMVNAISGIGNTSYMQSKSGRGLSIDVVSKKKKRLEQPDTTWKRKRKLLVSYPSIKLVIFNVKASFFQTLLLKVFSMSLRVVIIPIQFMFIVHLQIPDDTKVHVDVHLCENLKTEVSEPFY